MKYLRVGLVSRVCDHVDGRSVMFVGEIFTIEEDRKPVLPSISDAETEQRIRVSEKCVCVVDRISRQIALKLRSGVKANRGLVKQLRFIKMDWNAREPVVAINRVMTEMEVVKSIGLIQ